MTFELAMVYASAAMTIVFALAFHRQRNARYAERHWRTKAEDEARMLRLTFEALAKVHAQPERAHFLAAIVDERNRQDAKWGADDRWTEDQFARILGEEFGEVCKAINDNDPRNLDTEVIQVAAVCLKWYELGRRR